MPGDSDQRLLDILLDSWDRNNTILANLLGIIPERGLEVRAMEGSPSVAGLFMHMHYVRLIFVAENVPEWPVTMPKGEWNTERDRKRMAWMLNESAKTVREAVQSKIVTGGKMDRHYDHPILFLQHMIWHEGYHQGQIKLALKLAGMALDDEVAGLVTWDVWMHKTAAS